MACVTARWHGGAGSRLPVGAYWLPVLPERAWAGHMRSMIHCSLWSQSQEPGNMLPVLQDGLASPNRHVKTWPRPQPCFAPDTAQLPGLRASAPLPSRTSTHQEAPIVAIHPATIFPATPLLITLDTCPPLALH